MILSKNECSFCLGSLPLMPVYLALDDCSTVLVQLPPRLLPSRQVDSIAHLSPCIATGMGVSNVLVDCTATQKHLTATWKVACLRLWEQWTQTKLLTWTPWPWSPTIGWVQVMSTSLSCSIQLENSGHFESGSTSASALAPGPLVAVTTCDCFTSLELGISVGLLLNYL